MADTEPNVLYHGDNLDILRRYVEDESVDLVYLDPPFQSERDYNVLFEERSGELSTAKIQAFEDTWRWDMAAARAYQELLDGAAIDYPSTPGSNVTLPLRALRRPSVRRH